jgi:cystathionine beta-lyase/cystathionine gamma-synthase
MEKIETLTNHLPIIELQNDNYPLTPPIYQSVKFTYKSHAQLSAMRRGEFAGYSYSRVSNPTVRQLELLLARLQQREDAICTASGVGAITNCLMSILKKDDHVIMFIESYLPTRYLVQKILGKFGVSSTLVSITDHEAIASSILPGQTKALIFESPTNPQLKVADIEYLVRISQQHGLTTICDNTFAGFHNHGAYPIDIFIHSLTKYAGGHGDVMGGVIIGNSAQIKPLRRDCFEMGAVMDPHAAFLILRGMKTYKLRYDKQCHNAMKIATWLQDQPQVSRVYYPGLPSHPQHELAQKQMHDFGSMIMFDLAAKSPRHLDPFFDNLKLFREAASLGSTESLIVPAKDYYATDLSLRSLEISLINDFSIRLSIGIEDADDLIADLATGLKSYAMPL